MKTGYVLIISLVLICAVSFLMCFQNKSNEIRLGPVTSQDTSNKEGYWDRRWDDEWDNKWHGRRSPYDAPYGRWRSKRCLSKGWASPWGFYDPWIGQGYPYPYLVY